MHADFAHVTTWVFDLDNTLYPRSARLFDQIQIRMTDWVMSALRMDRPAADALRADYWRRYGTTLSGLIHEHGVDPAPYLDHVHDIALDTLAPDPGLARAIRALPGRKIVHTNGSRRHAERVTMARGLSGAFDAVYGIECAGYRPKPIPEAFRAILAQDGFDPARAAMFEDEERNLAVPHALGMRTVLILDDPVDTPHVHHQAPDLAPFLARIAAPVLA